jgi:glycosyltransferase involved in cell wall biosynthesis
MNVNGNGHKADVVHFSTAHSVFDVRIFKKECTSLARAGHHVTLIANGDKDATVDGVEIRALRAPSGRLMRRTVAVWRVYRQVIRQKGEIFHFHDPELLPVGLMLALRRKRVIYDVHENWPDTVLHKDWIPRGFHRAVSKLVSLVERYAASHMAGVVAAVEEIALEFKDLDVPVISVRNYPLAEEFPARNGTSSSPSRLGLHFGGVSPERVTRETVQALGTLPPELDFRLLLGGVCDSPAALAQVTQLPGWARVDYPGLMTRQRMVEEMGKACMAFVLYSNCPNHMDVRSNRLFEALAAGIPVVVSNFPKWQEFISNTQCGVTVDPHDPKSIAHGLTYLLEHPQEAAEMGKRGRQQFEREFNWKGEEARLLQLYDDILLAS